MNIILDIFHCTVYEFGMKQKKMYLSCSAGAGRTGTFIALSNILERVKAEGLLDVFQAVKSLRLQRPHMVQTLVCYLMTNSCQEVRGTGTSREKNFFCCLN